MTNADVERALERRRQDIKARRQQLAVAGGGAAAGAGDGTLAHPVGARVFDPVTGLEGEVIGGNRENVVVPTPDR